MGPTPTLYAVAWVASGALSPAHVEGNDALSVAPVFTLRDARTGAVLAVERATAVFFTPQNPDTPTAAPNVLTMPAQASPPARFITVDAWRIGDGFNIAPDFGVPTEALELRVHFDRDRTTEGAGIRIHSLGPVKCPATATFERNGS